MNLLKGLLLRSQREFRSPRVGCHSLCLLWLVAGQIDRSAELTIFPIFGHIGGLHYTPHRETYAPLLLRNSAHLLEEAVLELPYQYRSVIMLRDIEELSTSETAAALDLTEENVKVRLHRGRAMMRSWLFGRIGQSGKNAFPFRGARCDRVVLSVFARLAATTSGEREES